MKKYFMLSLLGLVLCSLAGCGNTENEEVVNSEDSGTEVSQEFSIDEVISNFVSTNLGCGDGKMFVNIAYLGKNAKDQDLSEYYTLIRGEEYIIDERGNLNDNCGFSIPMKFDIVNSDGEYRVDNFEIAQDGADYMDSIKNMFSEEAVNKLTNDDYTFVSSKSLLEQAEEYYGVKIIPEQSDFDCEFCDKLWYYEPIDDQEDEKFEEGLPFNYVSENNGNKTLFFGSDGVFKTEGSWDEGQGTWAFGTNKDTIIVFNESMDHIYDRYLITELDDQHMNTLLEIIQKN